MDDKTFFKLAVHQSLSRPLISAKDIRLARSGVGSGVVFYGTDDQQIHPAYFSLSEFQKLERYALKGLIGSAGFAAEFQIFRHYLSENIFVPVDTIEAQKLQQDLQLTTLSRAAAQKKKVLATVINGDFTANFRKIQAEYNTIIQQIKELENRNPAAVEYCQLGEFAASYRKTMQNFRMWDIVFKLNKKRFISYLCEAIQILRFMPRLPDDYLETRRFIGENMFILASRTRQYRNHLQYLLAILETMAQKDELLKTTQSILAEPSKYRQILQQYRTKRAPENLSLIGNLRQASKKLFRQYAFLTYIEGFRRALEYNMDEVPEARQPALPTVAPNEEIKKIHQLVAESLKIKASGRLNNLYNDALLQIPQTIKNIQKIIAS